MFWYDLRAMPIVRQLIIPAIAAFLSGQGVDIQVSGDRPWIDTGIDLKAGETLRIEAKGSLQYSKASPCGPEGLKRGWMDLVRILPLNDAGRGALIGRIGDDSAARPFLIGPRRESRVAVPGRLFLGINQQEGDKPEGAYSVHVDRTAAVEVKTDAAAIERMPKLTQDLLDRIPLRVADAEGNVGDRTNFVIVGSEELVRSALDSAGWVKVDNSVKDAILRGALGTFSREAYVTMPMSQLMLFGRIQDYGFAQADPVRVVTSRHHFRLWKAPFTLSGRIVWIGAGTHDIGIERDQRNGGLTHKIDPQVDQERDYIGRSLNQTGLVARIDYMTPSNPVKEAKTATGGGFTSDGRTLVVYLQPEPAGLGAAFADNFCSILKQENPDGGDWGPCSEYLDNPGKDDLRLEPLPDRYRVLIVPDFLGSCFSDSPAFLEGQNTLRDKRGMTVELLPVPNDGSESNGRIIARYLREHLGKDARKYIVVGYGKGTPDIQEALAKDTGAAAAVAAFVSVAGASGGTPIADALPSLAEGWIRLFKMDKCQGDINAGSRSMRREVRRAFLASYPIPPVPTYSLAAVSDESNTSKALIESWRMLSAFDKGLDGQLSKQDALVPGSRYVGAVRADHLAVALPFDKSPDSALRLAMDHNRFPRAALLEALLRVAIGDLESSNHRPLQGQ